MTETKPTLWVWSLSCRSRVYTVSALLILFKCTFIFGWLNLSQILRNTSSIFVPSPLPLIHLAPPNHFSIQVHVPLWAPTPAPMAHWRVPAPYMCSHSQHGIVLSIKLLLPFQCLETTYAHRNVQGLAAHLDHSCYLVTKTAINQINSPFSRYISLWHNDLLKSKFLTFKLTVPYWMQQLPSHVDTLPGSLLTSPYLRKTMWGTLTERSGLD